MQNLISKFMRAKIVLILFLFIGAWGCVHTPIATEPLINSQIIAEKENNLNFDFIDDREERFKTERCFVLQYKYPTYIFSCGDKELDIPFNVVFEKMIYRRFGTNPNGYKTEVKLKAFHHTHKPHELVGVPFVGLFAAFADVEYHAILKVEVSLLDKEGKFIFHKIYDEDIREMRGANEIIKDAIFDMLTKAFNRFSEEFETDISRIKLTESDKKIPGG